MTLRRNASPLELAPEVWIVLLAVVLRVIFLDIKPPHFDEGVNGWFADQMTRNGYFRYDPTNYHGPLYFYGVFASQNLLGRNLWALRLPAVICSILAVVVLLRFRDYFGRPAARLAALAMAVSPAAVFYGRYSIHESLLVLSLLTFTWGLLGLLERNAPKHLFATVGGATAAILTKETYVIHLGCFAIAGACLWLWQKAVRSDPGFALPKRSWTGSQAGAASLVAVFAIVFFYSGNFLDWSSLHGLWQTYAAWFSTGVEAAGHAKDDKAIGPINYYWLWLMALHEWPALLGFATCPLLMLRFPAAIRLIAIAGCGTFLAYSLIPYKTPWCIISILWPFFIVFGFFAGKWWHRGAVQALACLVLAVSLGLSIRLNFFHFTDHSEPYVYVQTDPGIDRFVGPLLERARDDPSTYHLGGLVLVDSYYPLPWMLGDFTRMGYYKKTELPAQIDGDFLTVEKSRAVEVESRLKDSYIRREYKLRDAMEDCYAYFRESLFKDYATGEKVGPKP